ncbi:hypothetical protein BH10CHL1_BH10CHL1_40010 [soil metagenome]
MKDETLPLGFLGKSIALAVILWVGINLLLFRVLYSDALTPLSLPYLEDFGQQTRLDYRQFGGVWHIRDAKLVQEKSDAADLLAVIPLTLRPAQPYQFGVHINIVKGPNGAGLLFNLQHANSYQQAQLVRFGTDKEGREYLSYGYFDKNLKFVEQGSLKPPDISKGVDLAVLTHKETYDILVNGQVLQRDIPLQFSGGSLALTTWFSSAAFDNIYVIPVVPSFVAGAVGELAPMASAVSLTTEITSALSTVPGSIEARSNFKQPSTYITATTVTTATTAVLNAFFTEKFPANLDQRRWTALSGTWNFTPGALVQDTLKGYDHNMLYASTFSKFTLRARFHHEQGVGGGVLFNIIDPSSKNNSHMVRYFAESGLNWGYFDAKGVFVGQGHLATNAPGTQAHTLQISADGATYRILLDDKLVAENVPLVSKQGYIGLTASQSIVAFETVSVTALTPLQK